MTTPIFVAETPEQADAIAFQLKKLDRKVPGDNFAAIGSEVLFIEADTLERRHKTPAEHEFMVYLYNHICKGIDLVLHR